MSRDHAHAKFSKKGVKARHVGGNAISAGTLTSRFLAPAPLFSCAVGHKFGVSSTLTGTAGTVGKEELLVNSPSHSISLKNTFNR